MIIPFILMALVYAGAVGFAANSFVFVAQHLQSLWGIIPLFLAINVFAGTRSVKTRSLRLRICCHGTMMLCAFYASMVASVIYQTVLAFRVLPHDHMTLVWSLVQCIGVHLVVFWNGILCVYLTSTQLGIKIRLIGILCGLIPMVNLLVLAYIIKTTATECFFESHKEQVNQQRQAEKVCATKYPILLVHGVFFRDSRHFNYWGRIPRELEINGATIFYGNHASAASVAGSAAELKERIMDILEETGAEKVNIIAHSKGGLDCRYAMAKLGLADRVASLTTINTPHKGCVFADRLLTTIPAFIKNRVAKTYNGALRKFHEEDSDFLAAVNDLTDSRCRELNKEMPVPDGVFCQSIGSVLHKATNGKFPMNLSYHFVKYFDGENDGLVREDAFVWGERYRLLRPTHKRGISHGDVIDLNRQNIPGFDVREFYVTLVRDLKNRGL